MPALAGFWFLYTIEKVKRMPKKLLYGLLYLVIIVAAASPFVYPMIFPAPTCTDGIQNQNETEVDCGGPCADCELKDLRLKIGGVEILGVGDRSSLLVKVENPSKNFGVLGAPYKFQVTGVLGELIEVVEGKLNIAPGEEKYIAAVGLDVKENNIGEATFSLGDFEFVPKVDLLSYNLRIKSLETTFPEEMIQVGGLIVNDSGVELSQVVLTALFLTKERDLANVGTTLISNLKAFEERDFSISVPRNDLFVDPEQTEISWRTI